MTEETAHETLLTLLEQLYHHADALAVLRGAEPPGRTAIALLLDQPAAEGGAGDLRHQQQMIAAHAALENIEILAWVRLPGSGALSPAHSTGLDRLLRPLGRQPVQLALTFDYAALADRSPETAAALSGALRSIGGRIVSVRQTCEADPARGAMVARLIRAFARYEHALQSARRLTAVAESVRQGRFPGGRVPFAYRYVRATDDPAEWRLEIDERQAHIVRRVFALHGQPGQTLTGIASALNAAGYRTAEGKPFASTQVLRILRREAFYRGEAPLPQQARAGGPAAAHPPILGRAEEDGEDPTGGSADV